MAANRTLQALRNNPIHLSGNLSSILCRYTKKGPGNAGIRAFLKEHGPAIQYHNPHVTVRREIVDSGDAVMIINDQDLISATKISSNELLDIVKQQFAAEA
eukprot:TRINITY_DN12434_c1_g1_i2.p1 TRINITY_DN12434_c1_g1~~TRINITY_DN12434_c1_g1_i2.p1  ORF type:complete len:108 (+),score=20.24 TRINITY_DN12434_c1_g1_i2:24-326(+)